MLDAIGTRVMIAMSEVCGIPVNTFEATLMKTLRPAELGVCFNDSSALRLKLEQRFNMTVTNEAALSEALQKTAADVIECVRRYASEPYGIPHQDARLLLVRLMSDRTEMHIQFESIGEALACFSGTLERFSTDEGFFFQLLDSQDGWKGSLRVPVKDRTISYSYCDDRYIKEIPPNMKGEFMML